MSKLKRIYKANIQTDDAIKDIYIDYFVSMGLNVVSRTRLGSAEYTADLIIKFGSNEYRRAAWEAVSGQVKKHVSVNVYTILQNHFMNGTGNRFIDAFDYKTRIFLKENVVTKFN